VMLKLSPQIRQTTSMPRSADGEDGEDGEGGEDGEEGASGGLVTA
jgi:hypothetical protein